MTYELTAEEKTGIIDQHLRSLEFAKYTAEVGILVENAGSNPDSDVLSSLNTKISDLDAKIAALNSEKALLG